MDARSLSWDASRRDRRRREKEMMQKAYAAQREFAARVTMQTKAEAEQKTTESATSAQDETDGKTPKVPDSQLPLSVDSAADENLFSPG